MEKIIVVVFVLMAIVTIAECDVVSTALTATTIASGVSQVGRLLSIGSCLYNSAGELIIKPINDGADFDYPQIIKHVLSCMGLSEYEGIANDIYEALKELYSMVMNV